ncbi:MAG: hypothetical protein ACE362_24755, partial [Phaeodactylibacter xiamenensis]|uniref:hypothetical protein n=1 Tax=Phaeodactylibacter xiamenensis TaxID=1524460 RepID=UPI00391B6E65
WADREAGHPKGRPAFLVLEDTMSVSLRMAFLCLGLKLTTWLVVKIAGYFLVYLPLQSYKLFRPA